MERLWIEKLAFRYDRHEESIRYIWMRHMYYLPMVMCVLRTFKNFQLVLLFQTPIKSNLIVNTFYKICILISLP